MPQQFGVRTQRGRAAIQAALDRGGARDAAAVARGSFPLAPGHGLRQRGSRRGAGDLYSLDGASFPGWPAAGIPTKAIDFIDNASYGGRMGQLQPLVTRRYADFGMQRSAICHPSGIAAR